MRGGEWDYKQFIHDMKILYQEIIDLSPLSPPDLKKCNKKFTHLSNFVVRSYSGIPVFMTSRLNHAISSLINP